MLTLQRQEEIMNILRAKKSATVAELSAALFASGSPIRRDLYDLENAGLIRRSGSLRAKQRRSLCPRP